MRRLALSLALAAVALTGCSGPPEELNPACDKKWRTAISMARCLLDIQPPPEDERAATPAPAAGGPGAAGTGY